ncbi:LysR substrate-binding domain-containing protein, partial [Streptomyces beijiangensis]
PLATRPDVALTDLAALPLKLTDRRNNPALVDLVVTACQSAGFEPVPGPTGGSLQNTLAMIGAGTPPMWTVVYAAHASQLHSPRVAFLPFRDGCLTLPTALVAHATTPPDTLNLLLKACTAPLNSDDHES